VTPLDWVFQHWSPRNVTSHHKECLTKRVLGDRVVRKKVPKYSRILMAHKKKDFGAIQFFLVAKYSGLHNKKAKRVENLSKELELAF